MQQQDRIAGAVLDVSHAQPFDFDVAAARRGNPADSWNRSSGVRSTDPSGQSGAMPANCATFVTFAGSRPSAISATHRQNSSRSASISCSGGRGS